MLEGNRSHLISSSTLLCTRPRASDEHLLESKPLASAPASLLLGVVQPDLIALDLTFKPTRGTVAALALPANLPLDFVAGELCGTKSETKASHLNMRTIPILPLFFQTFNILRLHHKHPFLQTMDIEVRIKPSTPQEHQLSILLRRRRRGNPQSATPSLLRQHRSLSSPQCPRCLILTCPSPQLCRPRHPFPPELLPLPLLVLQQCLCLHTWNTRRHPYLQLPLLLLLLYTQ